MHKKARVFYLILLVIAGNLTSFAQNSQIPSPIAEKLSVDDSRKFDYFFYEAMNAKATNQYDAVFDYLKYCMAIDSTNANVLYDLGNYYNSIES